MVSLSVVFNFPPIPIFSHWSFFQLNYSVHCAARFPSVDMANMSPLLPSHARESRGEGSDGEFSFPFYSPHSKLFLTSSFSNQIAIPSTMPAALPQSIKGTRSRHHLPVLPVVWRRW
jgi:hypothetical protein